MRALPTVAAFLVSVQLLCCAGCGGQPRGAPLADRGRDEPFTFVVLGDTRPGTRAEPNDPASVSIYYLEHIHWINRAQPDFSIQVGDLIVGGAEPGSPLTARQWDRYDRVGRMFQDPYFMVVGNHDIWDQASAELYRGRYGPPRYSFDHGGSHFVVLDSEVPGEAGEIGPSQLAWLEKDLAAAAGARHRFVFLHRPMWSDGTRYGSDTSNDWMTRAHPLLKRHKVDTVFAGHDHYYEFTEIDGIRYVITGGGGAELRGYREIGAFYHFLTVRVGAEGRPEIAVVERDRSYPQDIVLPGPRRWVESLAEVFASQTLIFGETKPQTVTYKASNALAEPMTLRIAWDPNLPAGAVRPLTESIDLAPGGSGSASFVLHLADAGDANPQLIWSLERQGVELMRRAQTLNTIRKGYYATAKAPAGKGTLLKIRHPGQVRSGDVNWDDPNDCSAEGRLTRQKDGFVFRVTVTDDKLRADGKWTHQRDSVEVYMDLRPPKARAVGGHETGTFQMMLLPNLKKTHSEIEVGYGLPDLAVPGAKATSTLLPGKGYRIEVFIPFAGLREKHFPAGDEFNFDFGVNDSDNQADRDSQLLWSGGVLNFMDTTAFGRMAPAKP